EAKNAAGVGVDDERHINEADPSRDVGEVRDPQHVRPWRLELSVDMIERTRSAVSATVVRTRLPRITPCKAIFFISRATVQRATSKPSRRNCRQTLRTP